MLTNKLKFFSNWDEKLLFCILFLTFFYVPIIEVQLLVMGKIFISNMHLKSLICLMILVSSIAKYVFVTQCYRIDIISLCIAGFCTVNLFILPLNYYLINSGINGVFSLIGHNIYVFLIALYYSVFARKIDVENIIGFLKKIAFINIILGTVQNFFNDPIWPILLLPDGKALFNSIVFVGNNKIRSFGFMTSGYELGTFLTTYYLFKIRDFLNEKVIRQKVLDLLLILVTVTVIYTTYTRNVYVLFIYFNLFLLLLNVVPKKFIKWFKLLYPITILFGINMGLSYLKAYILSSSAISSESIVIRFENWDRIMNYVLDSPYNLLFGYGKGQAARIGFLSDNIYIDTLLSTGIIGLVLLIAVIVFIYAKRIFNNRKYDLDLILYMCSSSVLCVGIFNLLETPYGMIAIVLSCCKLLDTKVQS